MKITKNTLKQMIREEINDIGIPEPELDPESPFARFYEIMVGSDRHPSEYALISRVERCLQDPEGAGTCADIANAASDALYELRRNMSSENHDRFRPLWAALAYLSDIPQNPEVHAGWKLNPKTIEDLKSGYEIFKQEKPHRSIALEEKKITKKQLTRLIKEEVKALLLERVVTFDGMYTPKDLKELVDMFVTPFGDPSMPGRYSVKGVAPYREDAGTMTIELPPHWFKRGPGAEQSAEETETALTEDASDEMRKKAIAAVWEEWCAGSVKKWPTEADSETELSIDTLPSKWKNNAAYLACTTRAKKLWAKMKKD
jgi:hypothetical protein